MAVRKTQDQYVQELVQENKRIHYMAYALIVLLIAVIVVSVLKQFMLTSILLVVAILYQIFVVRKQQRAYLKKCENTNLELSTLKDFSDTEIEEKGTQLSEQDLEAVCAEDRELFQIHSWNEGKARDPLDGLLRRTAPA